MADRKALLLSCAIGACLGLAPAAFAQTATSAQAQTQGQAQTQNPAQTQGQAKARTASDAGQTPETADQIKRANASSQNTDASSATAVGEVVVTALATHRSVQHIPVAVSAYTDERRNLVGIESASDLVNFTPSVSLNGEFLSIRGVGRYTTDLGTDPGVAVYVDGIYTDSPDYLNQPDFLSDRIEILRGPQGTLSGRNAIGGAVNVIEKRPTDEFHTEERLSYNNYNFLTADASVSGPLLDNVQGRLAYAYGYQPAYDGFVKNLGNSTYPGSGTTRLLEGQLNWDPTSHLNLWVKVQNYSSDGASTYPVNPTQYPGLVSYGASGLGPNPASTLPPTSNPEINNRRVVDDNVSGYTQLKNDWTFTTQATYRFPGVTVQYVGGYSQYEYGFLSDLDGTVLNTQPYDSVVTTGAQVKKFYQNEVDVKSDSLDRLQWIAGVFQYSEHFDTPFYDEEPNNATLEDPQYNGVGGCAFGACSLAPPNPNRATYTQLAKLNSNSQAVFGQIDYKLTDHVRLTGGLRYNWDEKEGKITYRYVYDTAGLFVSPGITALDVTPGTGTTPGGPASGKKSASWNDWSGKIGAEWQPNPTTLAYVSATKGYKSGGLILTNLVPTPEVGPETLYAYEGGLKKTFGDKLLIDADVYYYDYHNLQQVLTVDDNTAGLNLITSDLIAAKRARSYGFELESIWSPIKNLHITFNYSYLNARFTDFDNSLFPGQQLFDVSQKPADGCTINSTAGTPCPGVPHANLNGNAIPQSPENKVTLNPLYTFAVPTGNLTLSATYAWIDKQYYSVFTNPGFLAPSYSNVDLRALYQPAGGHFTLILFARNVTDERQIVNYGTGTYTAGPANLSPAPATVYPSSGQVNYYVNPPRTFGVELQFRY